MISTTARCTALALSLALLGACQSTKPKPEAGVNATLPDGSKPYDPRMWDKGPPEALGSFLAELDKSMRAWTNLTLTAQTQGDKQRARKLQEDLIKRVHLRQKELVDALESGPPRNRAIAAGGLGFSTTPKDVQGPLIVALADKDMGVVQNAAMSLALLQDRETPMLPLLEVMQSCPNGLARANAAYAVRTILETGVPASEDVIKAARNALVDNEPYAQAQGALILALAKDGDSVPSLTELLHNKVPLVVGAATKALLEMGRAEPRLLGPTARALVVGLGTAADEQQPGILRALVLLSGHNYADDVKEWAEWSQRLP